MEIRIIGCGYVGLVTAACFAEVGHNVICVDIDQNKLALLRKAEVPFFEPGLKELLEKNQSRGTLSFSDSFPEALEKAELVFLAVSTPSKPDGSCSLDNLLSATKQIAKHMSAPLTVVNKSTAPVGTTEIINAQIRLGLKERQLDLDFTVVANPEFLREGFALKDFFHPDRIVVGTKTQEAAGKLKKLYQPFLTENIPFLAMDPASAELTKYAANAMLATRISFMNELSLLAEKLGADIRQVALGVGSDGRIGPHYLRAGLGFGGSCLPKDLRALQAQAADVKCETTLLKAVENINCSQIDRLVNQICLYIDETVSSHSLAIWGVAFKAGTDDLREAPALNLIEKLLNKGFHLRLFDPLCSKKLQTLFVDDKRVKVCADEYECALGVSAIIVATEWPQFLQLNFTKILALVSDKGLFDARNHLDRDKMQALGFDYFMMGFPAHKTKKELVR